MDIIIQSLGFTAGTELESFIKEKLQSLNSDSIVRANVTLYLGSESNVENNICEIRLEVPGNDHFVKKAATAFEISVTDCTDILVSMINKERSKNIDRRQADAEAIQDIHLQAETEANSWVDLEDVVKP
ncbi:MAG: HPF/RaiA family ribosome-associated protein [Ferruginibacter sp.]